jgi:hypothetical protein
MGRNCARIAELGHGWIPMDLEKTLSAVPALLDAGVTNIEFAPIAFCRGPGELADFCKHILRIRESRG